MPSFYIMQRPHVICFILFLKSLDHAKYIKVAFKWLCAYRRMHDAPYHGHEYVLLRFWGKVIMKMGTQQQQLCADISVKCQYTRPYAL